MSHIQRKFLSCPFFKLHFKVDGQLSSLKHSFHLDFQDSPLASLSSFSDFSFSIVSLLSCILNARLPFHFSSSSFLEEPILCGSISLCPSIDECWSFPLNCRLIHLNVIRVSLYDPAKHFSFFFHLTVSDNQLVPLVTVSYLVS